MTTPLFMQVPLRGRSLIEASAGTGKTWTLAALYLRLLLDPNTARSVQSILTITFTEAATGELKSRIRKWIHQGVDLLHSSSQDSIHDSERDAILQILDSAAQQGATLKQLEDKLSCALKEFDLAAISTIHGFCSRTLSAHALPGGLILDADQNTNTDQIHSHLAGRFLREELPSLEEMFGLRFDPGLTKISALTGFYGEHLNHNDALLKPEVNPSPVLLSISDRQALWDSLKESWPRKRDQLSAYLLENIKGFTGNNAEATCVNLDDFLNPSNPGHMEISGSKSLLYFSFQIINDRIMKGKQPPTDSFFHEMDSLLNDLQMRRKELMASFQHHFLDWMDHESSLLMQSTRTRSFHDMIAGLAKALCSSSSDSLIQSLQIQHNAALVDEFQDTDPLQTNILNSIFPEANSTPLILVGDPKQSIYRFRGADVMAYTNMAKGLKNCTFSLETNFRAQPKLVDAVNALFHSTSAQANKSPNFESLFGEAIANPIALSKTSGIEDLRLGESPLPALVLKNVHADCKGQLSRSLAVTLCAEYCAQDIEILLRQAREGLLTMGTKTRRPLQAQDICILVGRGADAQLCSDALSKRGIASSLMDRRSVYRSMEADWLFHFFTLLAQPQSETLCAGFLTSPLCGFEIDALQGASLMMEFQLKLSQLSLELEARGCLLLLSRLLQEPLLPGWKSWSAQLLQHSGARRSLANIRHLAELLHVHEKLAGRRADSTRRILQEEKKLSHQDMELRLDSDDNVVRIRTIHAAKGLEFPVVFAPFLWSISGKSRSTNQATVHHEATESSHRGDEKTHRAILTVGDSDVRAKAKPILALEEQTENARQCYVALTRASVHQVIYAGNFAGCLPTTPSKPQSALSKLLGPLPWDHFESDTNGCIRVESIASKSTFHREALTPTVVPSVSLGNLRSDFLPTEKKAGIPSSYRMASFSYLLNKETEHTGRDLDAFSSLSKEIAPPLPAGATFGSFVHEALENMNFSDVVANPGTLEPVLKKGENLGLLQKEQFNAMGNLFVKALSTPLAPAFPALKDIPEKMRKNEMEFLFKNAKLTSRTIKDLLLNRNWPVAIPAQSILPPLETMLRRLPDTLDAGFFKGFIDLSFIHKNRLHLVDYKTNLLQEYSTGALWKAMCEHGYPLQYLIYAVAQHRLLTLSTDNPKLGGAWYLFLRGMRPEEPGSGVFHDPLDDGIVEAFDNLFKESEKKS